MDPENETFLDRPIDRRSFIKRGIAFVGVGPATPPALLRAVFDPARQTMLGQDVQEAVTRRLGEARYGCSVSHERLCLAAYDLDHDQQGRRDGNGKRDRSGRCPSPPRRDEPDNEGGADQLRRDGEPC